jgi:hypothetical protein
MNPKTKKYLLIGGAVVAVGAAIWWFFGRKKTGSSAGGSKPLEIKPVSGRFKKAVTKKGDLKSKIAPKAPIVQTGQPDQM